MLLFAWHIFHHGVASLPSSPQTVTQPEGAFVKETISLVEIEIPTS
jgi:hypothetical protein